jgi:hypothetical protein
VRGETFSREEHSDGRRSGERKILECGIFGSKKPSEWRNFEGRNNLRGGAFCRDFYSEGMNILRGGTF